MQHCRTAPSMCNGHPTGMWESSRSPSSFCSMIVPSIGTSIVALRLTCARLHFHASGASKPREASSASAGNSGCSFSGSASSLITSLRPCSGWAALGPLEVQVLWAPRSLRTRWGGQTGHLFHWRNSRS